MVDTQKSVYCNVLCFRQLPVSALLVLLSSRNLVPFKRKSISEVGQRRWTIRLGSHFEFQDHVRLKQTGITVSSR